MREMPRSSLLVIGLVTLGLIGSVAPAAARWRAINTINYDDGAKACPNGVQFGLAHTLASVEVRVVNNETGGLIHPWTDLSIRFAPVPELFGPFAPGEPYRYSRNVLLPFSPRPAVGDELTVRFRGTGANSTVVETVQNCVAKDRFEGFFRPVDNPPVLNDAVPGDKVNVRFGLFGDRGLDIFREEPAFGEIPCDADDPVPASALTDADHRLAFLPADGRYVLRWFTPPDAAGCYALFFRTKYSMLTQRALFRFGPA